MHELKAWFVQLRGSFNSRDRFCLAVLILLLIFHLVNNWIYLSTRVTLWGWDQPSHLLTTVRYHDTLQEPGIRSFFDVLTRPWNRPPLPWLPAMFFYGLFGVSTDVALMANAVFSVVLLFSVYGIGKKMYGHGVGVLAAFLVSMYPIIFSLSRAAYPDFALTALVAVNVYLMLLADSFRNRRGSLFLGLGLGLGLLTKWQFVAFASAPLAYLVIASGSISDLKKALQTDRTHLLGWIHREALGLSTMAHSGGREAMSFRRSIFAVLHRLTRSLWFHALISLILNLAWYVPNWDRMSRFTFGGWVLPLSWLLVTLTLFVLFRPPRQAANMLSALFIGVSLASIWSLPNIGYLNRFALVAYGGANLRGRTLGLLNPATYARYLQLMVSEQLSPLFFCAFLWALLFLVYRAWRSHPSWVPRNVDSRAWILMSWLVVPLVVFTFSLTTSARFDMALLPPVALITARAILKLKRSALRWALLSLLVFGGLTQFLALSYDDLGWLRERAILSLPGNLEINLLAQGQYIELPASGRTDPGYYIAPQVLDKVLAGKLRDGREEVQFGVLVNSPYVNSLIIRYEMYDRYPGITLRRFETGVEEPPFYPKLFECDYLLLMSGWRDLLGEEAYEAMAILESSPSLFYETFESLAEYNVPNGEIAYLYKKRYYLQDGSDIEAYRELARELSSMAREGDALIVEPAAQVDVLGRYYAGSLPVHALPEGHSWEEEVVDQELQGVIRDHERVFAVFGYRGEVDPRHLVEHWLNENGFRGWEAWYEGVQLVLYGTSSGGEGHDLERAVGARWEEKIELESYRLRNDRVQIGDILRLTLYWRPLDKVDNDYKVFIHLLDQDSNLVAQRDSQPVAGSRTMTSWNEGEEIEDNYGVLVSEAIPPGDYSLVIGVYSPLTGERLVVSSDEGTVLGDSLSLTTIRVVGE